MAARRNRIIMGLLHRAHRAWNELTRPVTLGVKAAIYDDQGRVLLVKHSYTSGWHLPGGRVDRDEKLVDAMRREVKEELGLTVVQDGQPEAMFYAPHHGKSDHIALFRVNGYSGTLNQNWEIAEAEFFPPTELPGGTTDATRRRIEELGGARDYPDRW